MDPNAALETLRELVKKEAQPGLAEAEKDQLLEDFAFVFNNLDEWLSKSGFPPDAWVSRLREKQA